MSVLIPTSASCSFSRANAAWISSKRWKTTEWLSLSWTKVNTTPPSKISPSAFFTTLLSGASLDLKKTATGPRPWSSSALWAFRQQLSTSEGKSWAAEEVDLIWERSALTGTCCRSTDSTRSTGAASTSSSASLEQSPLLRLMTTAATTSLTALSTITRIACWIK